MLIMIKSSIEYVERMPKLFGIKDCFGKDGFGLWIHDESMSPRYEPGELAYIHPNKPVLAGDYAVVQTDDDELFVRQYLGRKNGKIQLQQLNPLKTTAIPEGKVKRIHLIHSWTKSP